MAVKSCDWTQKKFYARKVCFWDKKSIRQAKSPPQETEWSEADTYRGTCLLCYMESMGLQVPRAVITLWDRNAAFLFSEMTGKKFLSAVHYTTVLISTEYIST